MDGMTTLTDRRQVVAGLAGAGALAGLALAGCRGRNGDVAPVLPALDDATRPGGPGDVAATTLSPASAEERLRRRLRRTTFGITPALLAEVDDMGWAAWLEAQLEPADDDPVVDAAVAGYATLAMPAAERRALAESDDLGRQRVVFELRHATLVRAVASRHQLREILVDHWNNHFNTDTSDTVVSLTKADEDAAFRAHALGPFGDLLLASASSPAMLSYLDNATSRKPSPNENYGRELLELHTVGVDGGYDEDDVVDTARAFTGWSIDRATLQFTFRPAFHDDAPKSVLGWATDGIAGPDGVEEGRSLLRYLAYHRATARHVTSRLVRRLVADVPPAAVVDAGVAAWEASGGRIADVVRAILDPDIFDAAVGPKVSRPFEALATMLRRVGATVPTDLADRVATRHAIALHEPLRRLGQPLFRAAPPTGYPDVAPAWVSTNSVGVRWDLAIAITRAHRVLGFDPAGLTEGAATVTEAIRACTAHLWLRPATADEMDAFITATGRAAGDAVDADTRAGLVALALAAGVTHER